MEDFLINELKNFFKKIKLDSMSKSLYKSFEKQKSILENSIAANELTLKRLIQDEQKIVRLILDIDLKNPMYALLKERYEIKYTHILSEIAEKKKLISELKSQLSEQVNERDSKELKLALIDEITNDLSKGIDVTSVQKKRILLTEIINKIAIYIDGDCEIEMFDISDLGTNEMRINN